MRVFVLYAVPSKLSDDSFFKDIAQKNPIFPCSPSQMPLMFLQHSARSPFACLTAYKVLPHTEST